MMISRQVFFLLSVSLACYTLSSYTLSRKKQKMFNKIMFGALGNTWRYKFYMGTQNDINIER